MQIFKCFVVFCIDTHFGLAVPPNTTLLHENSHCRLTHIVSVAGNQLTPTHNPQ